MTTEDVSQQTAADEGEPLAPGLYCAECDYDLRGLTSDRCPECGLSIDDLRTGVSRIPWVNRAESGRLLAYWRTVALVSLRARAFSSEVRRPVSFADAWRFRWVTVLHVYLPVFVGSLVALVRLWDEAVDLAGAATIPLWLAAQVGILLSLLAVTAAPRCFFRPRRMPIEKQNRAVALSEYASAALMWWPITVVMLAVGWWACFDQGELLELLLWLGGAIGVLVGLIWWYALLCLARRALRAGWLRVFSIAVGVPVLCVVTPALIVAGVMLGTFYLGLMLGLVS